MLKMSTILNDFIQFATKLRSELFRIVDDDAGVGRSTILVMIVIMIHRPLVSKNSKFAQARNISYVEQVTFVWSEELAVADTFGDTIENDLGAAVGVTGGVLGKSLREEIEKIVGVVVVIIFIIR